MPLTCTNEISLETEFYKYVDEMLNELNIDLFLLQVKLTRVTCMFLAIVALATAWDPVRPGALVKRLGDLIIVNQSVKVLLKFDNISTVRENVGHINQGIQMVKDQLENCNIPM